jgi:hypothetical protein
MVAGALILTLQALIFLTGNYTFFNLLAVALCVFLFDDRVFGPREKLNRGLPGKLISTVAVLIFTIGVTRMIETFSGVAVPALHLLVQYSEPFEIVNSYGLFATMTTTRPELIVEGSMDGENWSAYPFRYKPGNLAAPPKWVEPFQPRLDWQMWFAALGSYRNNPWFVNFAVRLLEGSPEVKGLLAGDPFNGKSPRYVRALIYEYGFTDFDGRRKSGNWWKREAAGEYLPAVALKTAPAP